MNHISKIFLVLLLAVILQSCALRRDPYYDVLYQYDENAPDVWKLGWQHGCESGFSAFGNDFHKTYYKLKQDVNRMSDPTYFKAWRDSYNYCRSVINRSLAGENLGGDDEWGILSTKDLNVTGGHKRSIAGMQKGGIFAGKDNDGLFSSMFNFSIPGWHVDTSDGCDWLNRCGADKPKDPLDAMLGL